jgi:hypothetical protein
VIAVEIRDIAGNNIVYAGDWQAISATERHFNETVNLGLATGGGYRIWVAYNKPMRWLDEKDAVEQYNNQTVSLGPQIIIEGFSELKTAFSQQIAGNADDWLTSPGGAGIGYLNYKSDAFMVEFTLESGIDPSTSTLLALAIYNTDLLGKFNDADPKTVVDWNAGWTNYEDSAGRIIDEGGIDRTIRIIDDDSKGFTEPTTATQPNNSSGDNRRTGGGSFGGTGIFWLLLLQIFIYRLKLSLSRVS